MTKVQVLLVEDDANSAAAVAIPLERTEEFQVIRAATLAEAITSLRTAAPDVVLLDLTLPDSSGVETFRRFNRVAPRVPTIILSGMDDEKMAETTVKEGAQDYLVKGEYERRTLIRAIRYAMERERIRRSLEDEREFTRALLDAIPDRLYVKDTDSQFLRINRQLATILGVSHPKEAIGKTDFDFFEADHAREAFEEEAGIMRSGRALIGKVEQEILLDGTRTWLLTTKMPVRDVAGTIVGTFGISKDITELKQAEEALRRGEERYRGLLESVMDYIYTVHLNDGAPAMTVHGDGCLTVTGYTREEYNVDRDLWARMIHPHDLDGVVWRFNRLIETGKSEPVEHRIVHKNGSIRWIRNTPTLSFDAQGRMTSYDGVVADITERKEAELQLRVAHDRLQELVAELTRSHEELKNAQLDLIEAAKMQSVGSLAAGVAHEVKNPLAILVLGLECLRRSSCGDAEAIQPVLREMEGAVERANTVVTGLLDFAASKTLELTDGDLNAAIEGSLKHVRHLLVQSKVEVVQHLGAGLPPAVLDFVKMEQVFINLFTNACHAMPGGGVLTIRTSQHLLRENEVPRNAGNRTGSWFGTGDAVLRVEILDTGTGIPRDKLARIFDTFFTTKPTGQGSGLGLAVTRSIVELHGGLIDIFNREEGGAGVVLTLRCAPQKEAASEGGTVSSNN